MDAFAARFEQPRDRVLGEPIDLQIRVKFAQLPRDGDIAATVTEPDRRRQVERSLRLCRLRHFFRRGNAKFAIEEIQDQCVALGREASQQIVAAARKGHQLRFSGLGHGFGAGIGLQLIVITVDHQHRTADLAIHRLADIELRYNRPRLHDPGQHGAGGFAGPFDAVLNLLGRVWIAKDVANEKFCKIGIVGQPVLAVVLVPAFKLLLFGQRNAPAPCRGSQAR